MTERARVKRESRATGVRQILFSAAPGGPLVITWLFVRGGSDRRWPLSTCASGASGRKAVEVQILSSAPTSEKVRR